MKVFARSRGFGLIEMLIAAAIVVCAVYFLMQTYLKKPLVDAETKKALSEQNIDTSTYKTTVQSVKDKIQDIEKQHADELNSYGVVQ